MERLVTVAKLSEMRQPDQTRIQLKLTDEEMQTGMSEPNPVGSKAPLGSCTSLSFQNGAEQARMITPSDDPEDAVNETVGMNNRDFCANLEGHRGSEF